MPSFPQPDWSTLTHDVSHDDAAGPAASQTLADNEAQPPQLSQWLNKVERSSDANGANPAIGFDGLGNFEALTNSTMSSFSDFAEPTDAQAQQLELPTFNSIPPVTSPQQTLSDSSPSMPSVPSLPSTPTLPSMPTLPSISLPSFNSPISGLPTSELPTMSGFGMPPSLDVLSEAPNSWPRFGADSFDPAPLMPTSFDPPPLATSFDPTPPMPTSFDPMPLAPTAFDPTPLLPTSFETTSFAPSSLASFASFEPVRNESPLPSFVDSIGESFIDSTIDPSNPLTAMHSWSPLSDTTDSLPELPSLGGFATVAPPSFSPDGFGFAAPESLTPTAHLPVQAKTDDEVAYARSVSQPTFAAPNFGTSEPFQDLAPSDASAATWNPHPAANLDQSSWSNEAFTPQIPAVEPRDEVGSKPFGSAFRLRDEGGFAAFQHAPNQPVEAQPSNDAKKSLSLFGLGAKKGANTGDLKTGTKTDKSAKAKKAKAKAKAKAKPSKGEPSKDEASEVEQSRSTNVTDSAATNAAFPIGDSNVRGASKLASIFKKTSPAPIDAQGSPGNDGQTATDDSGSTARLVRVLASVSLVSGLALGAYTIFSSGNSVPTSTEIPVVTTAVPDVGLAPLPPSTIPAVQSPTSPPQPPSGDNLDFSTGEDFSFSAGGDFSS